MRHAFNDLPQPVRERLVRICKSSSPQEALIHSSRGYATWFPPVVAVLALGGVIMAGNFLFDEAGGKAPYYDREIYLVLAGLVALLFVGATSTLLRIVWKHPPYRRGSYLFPSYLVIIHGPDLDVVPLDQIGRPSIVHRYRNGFYQGSTLQLKATSGWGTASFYIHGKERATQLADTFFAARDRMAKLLAARDGATLLQIDPFYECTTTGQWKEPPGVAKAPPLVDRVPAAASWGRWFGSAAAGLLVAGLTYGAMIMVCEGSSKAQRSCAESRKHGSKVDCCY